MTDPQDRTRRAAELPTDYLADFLMELDQVIQDFNQGAPSSLSSSRQYEQHLEERKRRTGRSSYDRGIDDPERHSASPGSSLSTSEEDLNTAATIMPSFPKAKLGDTQELEEFIAILDQALEEM